MENQITPKEIFLKDQVLTLEVAKKLIGKTIAITNSEYKANVANVRIFKILGIDSEYNQASKTLNSKYSSQQEMWIKENNQKAIEWAKKRTVLQYEGDTPYATIEEDNYCLPGGTFFGSDADREIYYVVL